MQSSIATDWSGAAAGRAIVRCAEYERQLGGGSPLSSLMAAKRTFTTRGRKSEMRHLGTSARTTTMSASPNVVEKVRHSAASGAAASVVT